jgi:catechol 2,3-dioxygenase-like lactoylglutathione lyase family enzyme
MSTKAIRGAVFSHGTMDSRNAEKTQRFLQDFLGVRSVRKSKGTQYVWLGGRWIIACLNVGENVPPRQGEGYRFALLVGSPDEVDRAHEAAVVQQERWEIREIRPVRIEGGTRAFWLQDLDGNWWEIYHRAGHLYDDLFKVEPAVADHAVSTAGR